MQTTIQIQKETRENLKKYGCKSESYNDIIERLMAYCDELNLEEIIQDRWERLQTEKNDYISLDEI